MGERLSSLRVSIDGETASLAPGEQQAIGQYVVGVMQNQQQIGPYVCMDGSNNALNLWVMRRAPELWDRPLTQDGG